MSDIYKNLSGLIWKFNELGKRGSRGRNPLVANFKDEGWQDAHIFIREYFQNVLDNRQKDKNGKRKRAKVTIRVLTKESGIDLAYNKKCLESLIPHLNASGDGSDGVDFSEPRILVAEEFNTTGLGGNYEDSDAEGDYARFFYGEGDDSKKGGMNGRAGQGKVTYTMLSKARSMIAYTIREEDGKRLLMGKVSVKKTHKSNGKSYHYNGFWSLDDDEQPIPFTDSQFLDQFINSYQIKRGNDEYGCSFVIPYPDRNFSDDLVIRVLLEDFFYSILKGRLEVEVGGLIVSKDTVFGLLEKYPPREKSISGHEPPSPDFLRFVSRAIDYDPNNIALLKDGWGGKSEINESLLSTEDYARLEQTLDAGDIIGVRFPVTVTKKGSAGFDSYFDVFLMANDEISATEEAFIRSDLFIAKEKKLKGVYGRAYALVIAEDEAIAELLANAEVASHLSWNSREERATDIFENVSGTLAIVRNSARRILELFKGQDTDKDEDLLIDILSVPLEGGKPKGKKKGGKGKRKVSPNKPPVPPEPGKQYHKIVDGSGVKVIPGRDPIPAEDLPVTGKIRIAYENLASGGNPFTNYHPLDFDLSETQNHQISANNVDVTSRDGNQIDFTIRDPDFSIDISGFSPMKQVRAKATIEL